MNTLKSFFPYDRTFTYTFTWLHFSFFKKIQPIFLRLDIVYCCRPERQTTRVEDQGLSTSFTAHSSGHFRPLDVQQQRGRSTMMEFAAPLPQPSQTSGMTPSYVQRANTFLERQRSVFSGHPHPFLSNTILQGGGCRMLFKYGYPT